MTDFAQALKARIVAEAGIGGEGHWGAVPSGRPLPYWRLQVISDPRPTHLEGYTGARITRVQADFFASQWGLAREMAEKVIAAVAPPATVAGVQFGFTRAEGPHDLGEEIDGIGFVHRANVDLLVSHRTI